MLLSFIGELPLWQDCYPSFYHLWSWSIWCPMSSLFSSWGHGRSLDVSSELCWVIFNGLIFKLWCYSSSGVMWTSTTWYFTFMGLGECIVYLVYLLWGCRSDRNLNTRWYIDAWGIAGSQSLRLWLVYLNYFLVFADACKGYNHKYVLVLDRRCISIGSPTQHLSKH